MNFRALGQSEVHGHYNIRPADQGGRWDEVGGGAGGRERGG